MILLGKKSKWSFDNLKLLRSCWRGKCMELDAWWEYLSIPWRKTVLLLADLQSQMHLNGKWKHQLEVSKKLFWKGSELIISLRLLSLGRFEPHLFLEIHLYSTVKGAECSFNW